MRQDELVLASTPTHAVCVAGVGVQSPLGKVSTAAVKPLPRLRQARWVQTREQTFNSSQTRARRGRHVSRQSRHPPFESRSHQGLCKSRQGPTRWCRATTAVRSDWPRPRHHPTGASRDDTASTGVGFGRCTPGGVSSAFHTQPNADTHRCTCTNDASVTDAVNMLAARCHSSEPRVTSTSIQLSLWRGHVSGNGYLKHSIHVRG